MSQTNKSRYFSASSFDKIPLQEWHEKLRANVQQMDNEKISRFISFPILTIHLARATDREKHLHDQRSSLTGLVMTTIDAVDGASIKDLRYIQTDEFNFSGSYLNLCENTEESKKAAIACLLSHLRAIRFAREQNTGIVCICEDDASFFLVPYWSRTLKEIADNAPEDWKMILLYNNDLQLSDPTPQYLKAPLGNGTVAYLISVQGQDIITSLYKNNKELKHLPIQFSCSVADSFLYEILYPHVYAITVPMVYPYNLQYECNSLIHSNHLQDHQYRSRQIIRYYYQNLNEMAHYRFKAKPPMWTCWSGNNAIPDYLQLCHDTVKKYNEPYFEVILVTPDNLHHFLQDIHPAYQYLSYTHRADYLRVHLLYHYGGVYVDMDTIGLYPLNEELHISRSVDIVGYDGNQWNELWGFSCLGPVKKHTSLYKQWKYSMNQVLDQNLISLQHFRKMNPETKDSLEWTQLLRSIGLSLQKKIVYSYHITKSWQPEELNEHKMIHPISNKDFQLLFEKHLDIPFLILNNSLYSSRIKSSSRKEIYESDILLFRIMKYALERPFAYAYPYIDKILYINLDHRVDRKKETMSELTKYFRVEGVLRVSAIVTPENGHYGCLQSHILALKKAVSEFPRQNILICEDDVEFIIDPLPIINKFFQDPVTHDWDVLLLNHSKPDILRTEKIASSLFLRVSVTQSACCYLVRGRYVSTLLQLFQDILDEYHKSKIWKEEYCVDQCWKRLQKKDRWYAYKDRVAKQRRSMSSISHSMFEYYCHR